jgi:membrane-associated protease RseP (regulator of RpoE activity)
VKYAIGVIAFSLALLLSVMLHELGHFATAKRYGMKASRFFVGFGPTLWSVRRGETEYGIKAIPAGGFVKIEGMTALEELAPADEDRAFYKQPARQRLVVLAAGSFMHFVIAIVLTFGLLAGFGQDPFRTVGLQIDSVSKCITNSPTGACKPGDPAAPAYGQLKAGDRLESVNGVRTNPDGSNVIAVLRSHAGQPIDVTVLRDGAPVTVSLTPQPVKVGNKTEGRIGIANEIVPKHVGVLAAVPRTFTVLGSYLKSTGSAISGLPHEVASIVEGKPRDANGAASVVDVARVSGQISASNATTSDKVYVLIELIAELNLFVGIFNLLPLLPLDGGHVAILAFESVRSRLARALGRRDPGRVDIMKVLPLTYAVVAVFVGLSLILLYAGITNPIRIQ